jgi:transcriptional regulator with XRE-family HTH domain
MPREKTPAQAALLTLRKKLGWTQRQLSEALGVTSVTVCRWESRRPPTGLSLVQLANFARDSGELATAQAFQQALFEHAGTRMIRRLPESAIESALRELQENRDPAVRREYLKLLWTLERVHALVIRQALANGMDTEACWQLQRTHQALQWEIEDAEKRAKTQP